MCFINNDALYKDIKMIIVGGNGDKYEHVIEKIQQSIDSL